MRKRCIAFLLTIAFPLSAVDPALEQLVDQLIDDMIVTEKGSARVAFEKFSKTASTCAPAEDCLIKKFNSIWCSLSKDEQEEIEVNALNRFMLKGVKFTRDDIVQALCCNDEWGEESSVSVIKILISNSDESYKEPFWVEGKQTTLIDWAEQQIKELEFAKQDPVMSKKELREEIQYFSQVRHALKERAQHGNSAQSTSNLGPALKWLVGIGGVGALVWLSYMSFKQYKKWKLKKKNEKITKA